MENCNFNIVFLELFLDSSLSNPRGSGLRELLEQLMIMQWENARVSSERPLALVIVKVNKVAKVLANYLARCPQLVKRNVKTTSLDGKYFFLVFSKPDFVLRGNCSTVQPCIFFIHSPCWWHMVTALEPAE